MHTSKRAKKHLKAHPMVISRLRWKKSTPDGLQNGCVLENLALDSSINAISFASMEGKITYVNKSFLDMWGYRNKNEVIGRKTYSFWASKKDADAMRKHLLKKGRWTGEMPARRKDGSNFEVRLSANLVKGNNGRPLCTMACFTDISEIKNALEALKKSETNFKLLFYSAAEGILCADIKTKRIKFANPAMCKMLGYTQEELIKLGVKDLHPKDALGRVLAEFEEHAHSRKSISTTLPFLKKDGKIIFLNVHTAHVVIDQRPCNVGFFTDITRQQRDAEALRESERRYHLLIEQLPAIIYTAALDDSSTTLYTSPQVREMLGISVEEYTADPDRWRQLIHPDDIHRVMADLKKSHKTGKSFNCEYRMIAQNGRIVWMRDDARIVKDSKGRPLYLQGVMYNITDRKKAEEDLKKARDQLELRVHQRTAELVRANELLRQQMGERERAEKAFQDVEKRFRDVFENALVGIYRTTPGGRILLANPALIKMLGYTSFEQLAGRNLEENGFEPLYPRSSFKKKIEKDGKVLGLESTWRRMDGTRLIVRESAAVVRDEHGKPLYYEGTVEDITDRKNAEEKLIAYQHQLRSLALDLALSEEHIRRQVAMNMHDYLGQNLAISKIKLDSLRQLVTSQKKADILDEVRTLLGSTIDSVRSLTFELSPPVLYELGFEAAVEWLVRYIGKRDGMLTDFHNDGKLKSLEDNVRILLFQSVREAIINVTKHAHAKKMSVSITREGPDIQISIVDDGVGFDVSKVRLLDEKSHAFGLLSIRERIGYIGGRFEIQSAPGKGTRVLLSAPVGKKSTKKRGNKNE